MRLKIINAEIFDPQPRRERAILLENGKVRAVTDACGDFEAERILDAEGLRAVPGFVDIHVHGGGGRSVMEGTPEAVVQIANAHARFGTTSILPTAWTAPLPEIEGAIDAVRAASALPCDGTIAGIHLEGPYLSPAQAGAQQPGALRIPAQGGWRELLDRWEGIRMMGVAPELEGAQALAEELQRRGIVATVAHSNAEEADMRHAVEWGFSDVTHVYSGCSTFTRRGGFRIPGVVECALAWEALTVQVIADGCHLPKTMLKLIYNAKGADGIELITDGLDYAGCDLREGSRYTQLNGLDVIYEDGVMKLDGRQAFAGSVATADRLLRTMVSAGVPFQDALQMLTVNPARRIHLQDKGRIAPGKDADVVFLDERLNVAGVVSQGRVIRWERNECT